MASGDDGEHGPALSAEFNNPDGVAVDASGNVYVADKGENVVRKIDTTGKITLFAGSSNGYAGYGGDGGPATSATLDEPVGIGFDPAGNLYIADSYNEVVRQVDTSGKIHTFAGTGLGGYSGDGGTATSATLDLPFGVAADEAGNIYIADTGNNVFRVVNTSNVISTFAGTGYVWATPARPAACPQPVPSRAYPASSPPRAATSTCQMSGAAASSWSISRKKLSGRGRFSAARSATSSSAVRICLPVRMGPTSLPWIRRAGHHFQCFCGGCYVSGVRRAF